MPRKYGLRIGTDVTPDYYVSNTGSDAADGLTPGTAWQTVAKVNGATFAAGDVIAFKRGDTWSTTTLTPPSSGSAGNYITFTAYGSGNKPIISKAAGADVISVVSKNYLKFDNLNIVDGDDGIQCTGSTYITIQNCQINGQNNRGIFLYGAVSPNSNITINNCTIYDIDADGIMNTSNSDVYIGYCTIYDVNNATFEFGDCIHMSAGSNMTVEYCTLNYDNPVADDKQCLMIEPGNGGTGGTVTVRYNSFTTASTAITSRGWTTGALDIYGNTFVHTLDCVSLPAYWYMINIGSTDGTGEVVTIHHNRIYKSGSNRPYFGIGFTEHSANVYNNTFYGMPIALDLGTAASARTITAKNNIVYSDTGHQAIRKQSANWTWTGDYNQWYRASGYTDYWDNNTGDDPDTLAELQSVFGGEANSATGDPTFTDAANGDFSLVGGSPCIDTGVVISGITDGYSGAGPNKGALE